MVTPQDGPARSAAHHRLGVALAVLLFAALAVQAAVYLTTWRAGAAAAWAQGPAGAVLRTADVVTLLALPLALGLSIAGRHWPGLLRGVGWRLAAIGGGTLFAIAIVFNEMLWRSTPVGPREAIWSADAELRANTLYRVLVLVLSVVMLFVGQARGAARSPAQDGAEGEKEPAR